MDYLGKTEKIGEFRILNCYDINYYQFAKILLNLGVFIKEEK